MTHHVLKAGLDAKGRSVGWHHRLVSENVDAVAAPPRFQATGGKDYIGIARARSGVLRDPERAGRIRCARSAACGCTPGAASAAGYNKFAAESFLDEIAHATRQWTRSRCGSS